MKELEMILKAVAQLGEAGKEAFIWWLVIDKGLTFIAVITIATFVFIAMRYAIRASSITNEDSQLLRLLASDVGITLYTEAWILSSERKELRNRIIALAQK